MWQWMEIRDWSTLQNGVNSLLWGGADMSMAGFPGRGVSSDEPPLSLLTAAVVVDLMSLHHYDNIHIIT